MKTRILILFAIVLLCSRLYAQIGPRAGESFKEIFIKTENIGSSETVYFYLDAVGHVWDGDMDIITSYDGHSVRSDSLTITGNHSANDKGWDHVEALRGIPGAPYFSFGKYKFMVKKGAYGDTTNFYIDFRDSLHTNSTYGCSADIWIIYDLSQIKIWWGNTCDTVTVSDNDSFTLWGEKDNEGSPIQDCFYPNAPYSLSVSDSSNHPKLTWSHDKDSDGSYSYQVWRNLSQTPVPSGTWVNVATTSNLNYFDTDIYLGDGSWGTAFYKIRAKLNTDNYYSTYSNIDDIDFEGMQKNAAENYDEQDMSDYLSQNNPNPFNPTTNILYSIAQKGNVTLRVYNSLAQEVALLVDGVKSEGEYSVKFDASNLPTGVYFYKLETDYFTDVKKMIVTK